MPPKLPLPSTGKAALPPLSPAVLVPTLPLPTSSVATLPVPNQLLHTRSEGESSSNDGQQQSGEGESSSISALFGETPPINRLRRSHGQPEEPLSATGTPIQYANLTGRSPPGGPAMEFEVGDTDTPASSSSSSSSAIHNNNNTPLRGIPFGPGYSPSPQGSTGLRGSGQLAGFTQYTPTSRSPVATWTADRDDDEEGERGINNKPAAASSSSSSSSSSRPDLTSPIKKRRVFNNSSISMFASPSKSAAGCKTVRSMLSESTRIQDYARGTVNLKLVGFVLTDSGALPQSVIYISCIEVLDEATNKRFRSSTATPARVCGKKVKQVASFVAGEARYKCDDGHVTTEFLPKFKIEILFEDMSDEITSSSSSSSSSGSHYRYTCTAMDSGALQLFGCDGSDFAEFVLTFVEAGNGTEAEAYANRLRFFNTFINQATKFYCTVDNKVKYTGGVSISLYEAKCEMSDFELQRDMGVINAVPDSMLSSVFGSLETNGTLLEQILPVPAMGDCVWYAYLAAYLCPVVSDEHEFNSRLSRLFHLPISVAGLNAIHIPQFDVQSSQLSLIVVLGEYRSLNLACNDSNSLWLKVGPAGDRNRHYNSALKYMADIVVYMRAVLVLYRRSMDEFALDYTESSPSDTPQDIADIFIEMSKAMRPISPRGLAVVCTLFGTTLSLRYWDPEGGDVPIHASTVPDAWAVKHSELNRHLVPVSMFLVNFRRNCRFGLRDINYDHYEGIIPRSSSPSGVGVENVDPTAGISAAASSHMQAGSIITGLSLPAILILQSNPIPMKESRRRFNAKETAILQREWKHAAKEYEADTHMHSRVAADFSQRIPCTALQIRRWGESYSARIRATAGMPTLTMTSNDSSASSAINVDEGHPVDSINESDEQQINLAIHPASTGVTKRRLRHFNLIELAAMTNANMTDRPEHEDVRSALAVQFTLARPSHPCSALQIQRWCQKTRLAAIARDAINCSETPVLNADVQLAVHDSAAEVVVESSLAIDIACTRRAFDLSEITVMTSAINRGITTRSDCRQEIEEMASQFSLRHMCASKQIAGWMKKNAVVVRRDFATVSAVDQGQTDGNINVGDGAGLTESAVSSSADVPRTNRRFSNAELSLLLEARTAGLQGNSMYEQTMEELADYFSSHSSQVCHVNNIKTWIVGSNRSPLSDARVAEISAGSFPTLSDVGIVVSSHPRPRRRAFSAVEIDRMQGFFRCGTDGKAKHRPTYQLLANEFSSSGVHIQSEMVQLWFRHATTNAGKPPPVPNPVKVENRDRYPRWHARIMNDQERDYLRKCVQLGLRKSLQHVEEIAFVAAQLSHRLPCSRDSIEVWLTKNAGKHCQDVNAAIPFLEPLPCLHHTSLPQHSGQVSGRNRRSEEESAMSKTKDISLALDQFWDASGVGRYLGVQRQCASPQVTRDEASALLTAAIGPPISDEIRSRCVREYNQYMDPHTPLLVCACCGVYEFNDVMVPLAMRKGSTVPTLTLAIPVSVNDHLSTSVLRLSDQQISEHLARPLEYQKCFSVLRVRDNPTDSLTNIARPSAADDTYSFYHLNGNLSYLDAATGKTMVRMCTMCHYALIRTNSVPQYSIASGCDYGSPSALNLPRLSLIESQLIPFYRVFAHIFKLTAPHGLGRDARQSAFQGHTIVLPHAGPSVCATHMPNLEDIHRSVSVMFLGTRAQWNLPSTRAGLLNQFQGIFQVRGAVVMLWLKALKGVGNPIYRSITIAADDDPCWARMESLGAECLDRAHIADDPATLKIDNAASSDVAMVRPHIIENPILDPSTSNVNVASSSIHMGLSSVMVSHPSDIITIEPVAGISSNDPLIILPPSDRGRLQVFQAFNRAIHGKDVAKAPLQVPLVSRQPLNEYTENDLLMLGAFPHLFFLGKKLPISGSMPLALRQKLLRQHDNRFAANHQLLFLLFNQMQRHAAARSVAARVRSSPKSIRDFYAMVNEPSFHADLLSSIKDPTSFTATRLTQRILPIIQTNGSSIPFSAVQRKQALPKLIAFTHRFGLPSFFLTISPSDLDQPLTVRLAIPSPSSIDKTQKVLDFPMPNLQERARCLADNPVAAAETFQRIMLTTLKTLVGLNAFHSKCTSVPLKYRKQGILGVPVAHFFVFESQGRGTLHTHGVVWGDLPPSLLEFVAEHPHLVKIIGDRIDEIVTVSISQMDHDAAILRRKNHVSAPRCGLSLSVTPDFVLPPLADRTAPYPFIKENKECSYHSEFVDLSMSFSQRWEIISTSVQCHTQHMATCRKGASGKFGCRMSMPQPLRPEPTGPTELLSGYDEKGSLFVIAADRVSPRAVENSIFPLPDKRVIIWELHRPLPADGYAVAFNKTITAILACNTALYILGSTDQARSILFYTLKYVVKDATVLSASLSAIVEAKKHVVDYPSVAADTGTPIRTAQHFMNRLLNNITGKTEISAEMASAALIGMPSTFASHDTWFCFVRPAISDIKQYRKVSPDEPLPGQTNTQSGNQCSNDDESYYQSLSPSAGEINQSDIDEADQETQAIIERDFTVIHGIEEDGEDHDDAMEQDEVMQVSGVQAPEESLEIYRTVDGKVIAVSQHLHYHFRGEDLAALNLYEWVALINVVEIVLTTKERRKLMKKHSKSLRQQQSAAAAIAASISMVDDEAGSDSKESARSSASNSDDDDDNGTGDTSAFIPNASTSHTYMFDDQHPMSKTHCQRVRRTHPVPLLAGQKPPPYPGNIQLSGRGAWITAARVYAEYMLTLMVPWEMPSLEEPHVILGPPMAMTYACFEHVFSEYQTSADINLQCRAQCIVNITHGLATTFRAKKMQTMYRNRAVQKWGARGVNTPADGSNPDGDLCVDHSESDDGAPSSNDTMATIEALRKEARADDLDDARSRKLNDAKQLEIEMSGRYANVLSHLFLTQSEMIDRNLHLTSDEQLNIMPPSDEDIITDPIYSSRYAHDPNQLVGEDGVIQYRSSEGISNVLDALRAEIPVVNNVDITGNAMVVEPVSGHHASFFIPQRVDVDESGTAPASCTLNAEQKKALEHCTSWLTATIAHEQNAVHCASPPQLLLIIHGGAGVGKSTFALALIESTLVPSKTGGEPVSAVVCCAPTGIAASVLLDGRTMHSLLGLGQWSRLNAPRPITKLQGDTLTAAQTRFRGKFIILFDEMSMIGSSLLGAVDARLRNILGVDLPFGGMGIVMMGDFYQLAAVLDTPLPTKALNCTSSNMSGDDGAAIAQLTTQGGILFRSFRMIKFTQQMRVMADDVEHTAIVESFQRTNVSTLPRSFITHLQSKYINHSIIDNDPSWMDASIIVPTNKQRFILLPPLVIHFALRRRLPVYRWRYPINHAASLSHEEQESLYRRYPSLSGYFVQGAPVFITKNINPSKCLANGTAATMHSLSWESESYVSEIVERSKRAAPGEIIEVNLPSAINVEISMELVRQSSWIFSDLETLVSGRIIVPLDRSDECRIQLQGDQYLRYTEFICELAFVITFHKCQGRTIKKVILDLNKQPGHGANVTYSSLYVGLSRVRRGSDVTLFPYLGPSSLYQRPADLLIPANHFVSSITNELDHLMKLKPSEDLILWMKGFDDQGVWSLKRSSDAASLHVDGIQSRSRLRAQTNREAAVQAAYADRNVLSSVRTDGRARRVFTSASSSMFQDPESGSSPSVSISVQTVPPAVPANQIAMPIIDDSAPVPMDVGYD